MGHRKIEDGRLSFPVESAEFVNLANKWLSNARVLCPGLVGLLVLKKAAKYGMSLAVITSSRLQTECRKSVGIVSSANDMRKVHSIIDNP